MAKIHGIGEILKSRRIQLGLSLEDIENETKIRTRYLEAIEEENFEVIPGRVYLKGFVKTYAKFLNVADNEEIIRFLKESKAPAFEIEKTETIEQNAPKRIPKKYVTVISGILALLVLFGMQNLYSRFFQDSQVTPPRQETGQTEEPIPPISQEPEPQENGETETEMPTKKELVIEILDLTSAQEKCWMQVYSDNILVYEGTMYEGEKKIFSAQEKLKFKLGNAGVVKLLLGETDLGILGKVGQVIEKEIILSEFQEHPL
ncbi:MAG: helix-turn-helix domain-containing protein [Clostridia bacterium]|nr:helix-turn-helix domain-containing protein [Clostridia bacterium]